MPPTKRKTFKIAETEAVKLGYFAHMDKKQPFTMTKAMFPYALRNRTSSQVKDKVKNLFKNNSITPSMAPTRDPELAICLSVKLFGPEEPNLVTFEKAKLLYQDALEEFTPEQIKTQYETTLRSKVNEVVSRLEGSIDIDAKEGFNALGHKLKQLNKDNASGD
jgi:hypothetical protein